MAIFELTTRNLKLLKESLAIGVFIDLKKAIASFKNSTLYPTFKNSILLYTTFKNSILLYIIYGVRGISLSWFQDDLNSRCQFLELANCRSSLQTIKCGVPQRSLLGSFLFLVYINDIFSSSLLMTPPSFFSIVIYLNLALLIMHFPLLLHSSRLIS